MSLPILREVRQVLREMEASQRLEIDYRENWTPMALQQWCANSCTRPNDRGIQPRTLLTRVGRKRHHPGAGAASGMVTRSTGDASLLRHLGAHVAVADRQTVDRFDRVAVPQKIHLYLRRVWLSQTEKRVLLWSVQ